MTITFLQPDGVPITAQAARQGNAAVYGGGAGRPLGGRSGFRVDTASNILTATSTTWTLKPCAAMIDPGASTAQGMYGWATDANVTGAVTASDVTNSRIDIVYIQVNDSTAGDGSGATSAPVLYLAGTPAATPAAPTLPARSFLVGTITVPKTGGGSPTVVLNPARFAAAGAPLPVYSQAERDALVKYDGLIVQRRDLPGRPTEACDGAKWFRAGSAGIAYTPIWTGVTDFGSGGTLTGTYWVDGNRVTVRSKAKFGAGGSLGSSAIICPLPPGYPIVGTESSMLGSGIHATAAGVVRPLVVFAGSSTTAAVYAPIIPVQTPGAAGYPGASGDSMEISISYQTSGS